MLSYYVKCFSQHVSFILCGYMHLAPNIHIYLLCHYDSSIYIFWSVDRLPTQRAGIFHQQPSVPASTIFNQHLGLEHIFQPILAGHCVDYHSLSTETLIMPKLDEFYFLDFYHNHKRRVPLLLQCMFDLMRQSSPSQGICEYPLSTPPQLTHTYCSFIANGHFCQSDFKPLEEGQDNSVSMYTFSPCILRLFLMWWQSQRSNDCNMIRSPLVRQVRQQVSWGGSIKLRWCGV